MVDLDELEMLRKEYLDATARAQKIGPWEVNDEVFNTFEALNSSLRDAAEELIRDARRWRALDAAMAERGHQWTTTTEQVAAMLKILKEPT